MNPYDNNPFSTDTTRDTRSDYDANRRLAGFGYDDDEPLTGEERADAYTARRMAEGTWRERTTPRINRERLAEFTAAMLQIVED